MAQDTLTLTKSQQRAYSLFLQGHNLFITGKGGSGKSYLTRYIIDSAKSSGRSVIVCAPTGIAAINVHGATIHRTFQAPVRIIKPHEYLNIADLNDDNRKRLDKKGKRIQEKLDVIRKADVVIIDEVSMCRLDLFGYVARTLLSYDGKPKQVVVVGDFYQLPPVLSTEKGEARAWQMIPEYADKVFAFQAPEWKLLDIMTVELTENMRQKDKAFISALDDIREGIPNFTPFGCRQSPNTKAITLCPNNKMATSENERHLNQLIKRGRKRQLFRESATGVLRNMEDRELEKYRLTGKQVELCIGARVIVLVNAKDGTYVNGDMGDVTDLCETAIHVKLDSGRNISLEQYTWSVQEYQIVDKVNKDTGKKEKVSSLVEIGSIKQIPVKLAWAISVHKSQGQTYDCCNIRCGFWTEGQMYVALSRCRSLDGLRILGELSERELMCSEEVKEFMHRTLSTYLNNVTINKETTIPKRKHERTLRNPKGAGRRPRSDQTTVRKNLMRLTETEKMYIELLRDSEGFSKQVSMEYNRWINK